MNRPHQPGSGRLQRLGDEPGEAPVVAHAGDQRYLAAQIDGDHAFCFLSALREPFLWRSRLANWGNPGKVNRLCSRVSQERGEDFNAPVFWRTRLLLL